VLADIINITGTTGNITSNNRTLHTHTHAQPADSATDTQTETSSPTSGS
jgi:hypothetical protein